MSIGSAKTEGTHSSQGWTRLRRPRTQRCLYSKRDLVKRNMRVRLLKVQARWDLQLLERQRHLDQASNASRGLQVADIGLDRAQGARSPKGTVDGEHCAQGF